MSEAGEQTMIPGTEPVKNPQVHALAKKYAKLRDKRMNAGIEEKDAKNQLIGAMKAEGLEVYEFGEVSVELDTTEKVKVTIEDGE